MAADYNLVPTDQLFAKIEDQLNSYTTNGLLDVGRFYSEVKLIINKLGIAAYDMTEAIVTLENHKAALPCNFYLLDSAWLCDSNPATTEAIIQSNFIMYNETTNELISQKNACGINGSSPCGDGACNTTDVNIRDVVSNGLIIQSTPCNNNNENVLEKVTVKEYLIPEGRTITWRNPVMLKLKNKKSVNTDVCTKDCKNLFARSIDEISIVQQGFNKFIHSTLEKPIIYLKYYAYPEDPETGLPLIPEEPIIQRAIEFHLMHYFFYMAWLDGTDVNIERKVQDLELKRDKYLTEAINYSKMPSFNKAIEMARKTRKKFAAYELLNSKHI